MCDVTLIVGDLEVHAHRNVLAARSAFFRDLLASSTTTVDGDIADRCSHHHLPDIDASSLQAIVGYLYTDTVRIDDANAGDLLAAAAQLRLPALRNACADHVAAHMTADTCLRVRRLAELHECAALRDQADAFIALHCAEMLRSTDFGRVMHGQPLPELRLTDLTLQPSAMLHHHQLVGQTDRRAGKILMVFSAVGYQWFDFERQCWKSKKSAGMSGS